MIETDDFRRRFRLIIPIPRVLLLISLYEQMEIRAQAQPQTKAEKNKARLKQLRGRAGRWS